MSWRDVMYRVLPPIGGVAPHVTSPYGAIYKRPLGSTNPHRGVDFNYNVLGGQSGINLKFPKVHSPVDGVVTNAGQGTVGRIAIRDKNGFSHEILHTQTQHVAIGDRVAAGDLIGTMGNIGADPTHPDKAQYHVHYQLIDPAGRPISPSEFWDQQDAVYPVPSPPAASDADLPNSPAEAGTLRRLGKRIVSQSQPSFPDGGTSAVPFISNQTNPVSRSNAFDDRFGSWASMPAAPPNGTPPFSGNTDFSDRFGNWASSPAGTAPASPPIDVPRGIVTGQPMRAVRLPPSIWRLPDGSGASDDDDWFTRWFK
jgi:hypothetical protein